MNTERIALTDLVADPANVRVHKRKNLEAIKGSLLRFGQQKPIVIDAKNVVVAGNGTLEAAREIGWTHLECVRSELLGSDRAAFSIADNRTAELADWDRDALGKALEAIRCDMDALATGFTEEEVERLVAQMKGPGDVLDDAMPALRAHALTENGDLWLCGDHRLLCGSSTNGEDVERLMDGERAQLFATDPPYLVDYTGLNHPQHFRQLIPTENKDWSDTYREFEAKTPEEGRHFYSEFIRIAKAKAILENAAWYCWHATVRQTMLESVWIEHGAFVHQTVIWAKTRAVLTRSIYMWGHEHCFVGWVRGKRPPIFAKDLENTTVWNVPSSEIETAEHPTSKPVRLFAVPIRMHTKEGELCYEPFSGSGSQLIAAEKCRRRCYAMEIEPRFVDLAVARWENLTGRKAQRIGSDGTERPGTDADEHPAREGELARQQEPTGAATDAR